MKAKHPSGRCSISGVHISMGTISAALQSRFALRPVGSTSRSTYFPSLPAPIFYTVIWLLLEFGGAVKTAEKEKPIQHRRGY